MSLLGIMLTIENEDDSSVSDVDFLTPKMGNSSKKVAIIDLAFNNRTLVFAVAENGRFSGVNVDEPIPLLPVEITFFSLGVNQLVPPSILYSKNTLEFAGPVQVTVNGLSSK